MISTRANNFFRHNCQHLIAALFHQGCQPSATSCTTSAARNRTQTWRSRSPCAAGHFTMAPTCSSPACSSPAWPCWSSCSPLTPGRRFHWVRPQDTHHTDTWWQSHKKRKVKEKYDIPLGFLHWRLQMLTASWFLAYCSMLMLALNLEITFCYGVSLISGWIIASVETVKVLSPGP